MKSHSSCISEIRPTLRVFAYVRPCTYFVPQPEFTRYLRLREPFLSIYILSCLTVGFPIRRGSGLEAPPCLDVISPLVLKMSAPKEKAASMDEPTQEPDRSVPWYRKDIGEHLSPATREMFRVYCGLSHSDLDSHLQRIVSNHMTISCHIRNTID